MTLSALSAATCHFWSERKSEGEEGREAEKTAIKMSSLSRALRNAVNLCMRDERTSESGLEGPERDGIHLVPSLPPPPIRASSLRKVLF